MAKLSSDQINFILSLDASGLQKEISKTTQNIKDLKSSNVALKKDIKALERDMAKTAKTMSKMEKAGKTNTDEYKALSTTYSSCATKLAGYNSNLKKNNEAIDENTKKQQLSLETLKDSEMTMSQLKAKSQSLQTQLNNTSKAANPEEYAKLESKLGSVKGAMADLTNSGDKYKTVLSNLPAPIASVTGVIGGLKVMLQSLLGAGPLGVIILVIGAIIALFTGFKKIINSSEEATNKFNQILAPFNALLDALLNVMQKVVGVLLDGVLAMGKFLGAIMSVIPGLDKLVEKNKEAINLEKDKQQLAKDERDLLVSNAQTQNDVSELRSKAMMKDKYSAEERLSFINQSIKLEEQQMEATKKLREEKLRIDMAEAARAENTAEVNEKLAQLQADAISAETDYNNKTRELLEKKNAFAAEIETERKAAATAAVERQKKEIEYITKSIEDAHEARLRIINRENSITLISESSKNLRILNQEKSHTQQLLKVLTERIKKVNDLTLKNEIRDNIIAAENELIAKQREIDEQKVAAVKETYTEQSNAIAQIYDSQKVLLDEKLSRMQMTQEEYAIAMMYLEEQLSLNRLNIADAYEDNLTALTLRNNDLREAAIKEAHAIAIEEDKAAATKRLEIEQQAASALYDFKESFGLFTEEQLRAQQLSSLEATYTARKKFLEREGLSTLELEEAYQLAKSNMIMQHEGERFSLRQQLGLAHWNEEYEMNMANLKAMLESEAITHEEYDKAIFNAKMGRAKSFYDSFAGMASSAVQAMQQAETDSIDAKYDAQIAAAGDNAEEVERLEQEKAQKKLDIEKKYADVNFAIKVSEIVANTAVAIMQGFAQMGPIGGAIAAVLMTATGAAQIVSANAERQKIKNMTLNGGGSSAPSQQRVVTGAEDGGYVDVVRKQDGKVYNAKNGGKKRGYIDTTSILVSENGREFVASAETVNNPTIRPLLDIIDSAQRRGVSGQLNLASVRLQGYAAGGYVSAPAAPQSGGSQYIMVDNNILLDIKSLLQYLKENGVKAPIVLSELQKKMELQKDSDNYANK